MKSYHITIFSKNQISLNNFISFFFNNKIKFNQDIKYFQKKKKIKIFTILKSPHVNKKSQEQFEYRIFSKQLTLYSNKAFKYLIFLKKVQINLFSDVFLKIKFLINKRNIKNRQTNLLNPNNFTLNLFTTIFILKKQKSNFNQQLKNYKKINLIKKTINYIKIFDSYGEINIKN